MKFIEESKKIFDICLWWSARRA